MRIGIDIDDTLADTTNYIMPILVEYDKSNLGGKGIVFKDKKHMGAFDWTEEERFKFRDDVLDDYFLSVPIKNEAKKYLKRIKDLGHQIIIITARDILYFSDAHNISYEWLIKNDIPFDKLIANSPKKGEICVREKIDLFIDDSFGQATYVAENVKIPVLMPVDEYNKDKEFPGLQKVNSWEEIYNIIKSMSDSC